MDYLLYLSDIMENTLDFKSSIMKRKWKFFINRILTYFSFLLLPYWIQKTIDINPVIQVLFVVIYSLFMLGQWYLLGKEIDHRFKIYYRTTSSMDRICYRAITGSIFLLLYFNLISLVPSGILKHFFWGTFSVMGLFYSWPTRGKIIKESISTQFSEYKYLDSFEKTVLFLTLIMFLFTLPEIPRFESIEALKLYIDPNENIHNMFWNFLRVTFFPFKKFSQLYQISWFVFIYLYGLGMYIIAFYGLLRFFFSRRIAILGIFSLVSSWSFSKLLVNSPDLALTSTFTLLWIWSFLWSIKSYTYRSGLILGLVPFLGCLVNVNFVYLLPVSLILVSKFLYRKQTVWYRKQILKYMILGGILTIVGVLTANEGSLTSETFSLIELKNHLASLVDRKAFYSLSVIGIITVLIFQNKKYTGRFKFEYKRFYMLLAILVLFLLFSLFVDRNFFYGFGVMFFLSFFSLIPLEFLFQSITRLRSKRNVIFFFYFLVCLMDSHFEGRIKIFMKLLNY